MIKILETTFLLYQWTSDRYSLPVVPKPKHALESPGGLVETQTAGSCSQKWVGPENSDVADASGSETIL